MFQIITFVTLICMVIFHFMILFFHLPPSLFPFSIFLFCPYTSLKKIYLLSTLFACIVKKKTKILMQRVIELVIESIITLITCYYCAYSSKLTYKSI